MPKATATCPCHPPPGVDSTCALHVYRLAGERCECNCLPALNIVSKKLGLLEILSALRTAGWMVAVHNDYRQAGQLRTFWLFTHPNGHYIKGEGRTDEEAVRMALQSLKKG